MADYIYNFLHQIVRKADGAVIPSDPMNADYQTFLASGEMPDPAPSPSPTALCVQVDVFRNARLAGGFADMGAGGTGKTWQCDPGSIGLWTPLAAAAQPYALGLVNTQAPTFTLIASDNSENPLTAAQTYALLASRVMPWVSATMLYGRTMKNNILAGNPPADITQGWP